MRPDRCPGVRASARRTRRGPARGAADRATCTLGGALLARPADRLLLGRLVAGPARRHGREQARLAIDAKSSAARSAARRASCAPRPSPRTSRRTRVAGSYAVAERPQAPADRQPALTRALALASGSVPAAIRVGRLRSASPGRVAGVDRPTIATGRGPLRSDGCHREARCDEGGRLAGRLRAVRSWRTAGIPLEPGAVARCTRCEAVLGRGHRIGDRDASSR